MWTRVAAQASIRVREAREADQLKILALPAGFPRRVHTDAGLITLEPLNRIGNLRDEAARMATDARAEAAKGEGHPLAELNVLAESWSALARDLGAEYEQRALIEKQMGFDALFEGALLVTDGPHPVAAPVRLRPGETAFLVVPATLCRMVTTTSFAGTTDSGATSRGFSIPILETGIRYETARQVTRGQIRLDPIPHNNLIDTDSGDLTITSLRVVYAGATKLVNCDLQEVVRVEGHGNGISVLHEGTEDADFYKVEVPARALMFINWVLRASQNAEPGSHGGKGLPLD